MPGLFSFAFGALLLGAVVYDFLCTAISLRGLGPLSGVLVRLLWRAGRALTLATERHLDVSLRGLIGPTILSLLAGAWIVLHLAAYTLLYLSGPSLEVSQTGAPASVVQIVAFAGSALSTLGASTVTPTNGWWDILSMVAAVNGMVVLTLSVSFILTIIQSTTSVRQWAVSYTAIRQDAATQGPDAVGALGPDLCGVAAHLPAAPLIGVFVPKEAAMSFPRALLDLIRSFEAEGVLSWEARPADPQTSQLLYGIGLLGRHVPGTRGATDFETARLWAERHSLPPWQSRSERT